MRPDSPTGLCLSGGRAENREQALSTLEMQIPAEIFLLLCPMAWNGCECEVYVSPSDHSISVLLWSHFFQFFRFLQLHLLVLDSLFCFRLTFFFN